MNPRFFGFSTLAVPLQPLKSKKSLPSPEVATKQFSKELDALIPSLTALKILNDHPDELLDDIVGLEVNMIIHSRIFELFQNIVLDTGEFAKTAITYEALRSKGCYEEKENDAIANKLKQSVQAAYIINKNYFNDDRSVYSQIKDKLDAILITLKNFYLDVAQISHYVPPTIEEVTQRKVENTPGREMKRN